MPQATKLFSKSLTDTDTRKRLAIPVKILPELPDFNGGRGVKINLIYGTKEWPIICCVRKNGYKKPVFSGGWRNFVICNSFNVGDKFTLYKVQYEAGYSLYRVEVEKPTARPTGDLSPCAAVSLNHDFDYIISKPSCWIFGTNLSDEEANGKAHFKTEMKISGICMGQAAGEAACCKSSTIEMDLVEGQASTQYAREVNLNLTLSLPCQY